jgi:hypothetical protein
MALEPGEVLGETIAQPASLNTLAARDAAATWVRRGKVRVNYGLPRGALNSAVECHLHTVEVAGSNPAAPTITNLQSMVYLLIDSWATWASSGPPIPVAQAKSRRTEQVLCPYRVKQS